MGPWGVGTFENDDAGVRAYRREESEGLTLLTGDVGRPGAGAARPARSLIP
jgi:hypothetical protein